MVVRTEDLRVANEDLDAETERFAEVTRIHEELMAEIEAE